MARPLICVSVAARSAQYAVKLLSSLEGYADLAEVRLDYASGKIELDRIRAATELPLIATNRMKEQGGLWGGDEEDRINLLLSALDAGMEYCDFEISTIDHPRIVEEVHGRGSKLIASYHNFKDPLSRVEMEHALNVSKANKADICKVIGLAHAYSDNVACLAFLKRNPGNICFALGAAGVPSRVLSPLVGGAFTYASAGEGEEVAPGQITAKRMREIYKLMGIEV